MWNLFKPKINDKLIEDKVYYQDLVLTKLSAKIKNASKNGSVCVTVCNDEMNEEIIKILEKKGLIVSKTKSNNIQINW